MLSGPDHIAAVLPLAARAPEHGRHVGAVWGLGHGGGMLFWLALAWSFRQAIPLATISGLAELLVGFSLIAVGLWTLREQRTRPHSHKHAHRAVLGLGVLHGTAGAGHMFAVLPLLGLSLQGGALYCLGFVAAGVASMAGAGLLAGQLAKSASFGARMRPVCASLTLLVGGAWIVNALLA